MGGEALVEQQMAQVLALGAILGFYFGAVIFFIVGWLLAGGNGE